MRVNVVKAVAIGPWSKRDLFFQKMQEEGFVEFISPTPPSLETPEQIQTFIDALHVLRHMVPVKQAPSDDYRSANVLARHVVERNGDLERLEEEKRVLEKEISRIQVFGDFSLDTLQSLEKETGRVFQFFFAKHSEELEAPEKKEVIFVGSAYGLDYFVSIQKQRVIYDGMIEIVIDRSLGDLEADLAGVNRKIDEYETELATLAHKKDLLKQGLTDTLNHYHLDQSKNRVESLVEGQAFAVEGWIPKNKLALIQQLGESLNVYIEPVLVEEKDKVPTYLENRGVARLGEDLIGIYDTPSSVDRDPSLWVFISFAIFFSMILADAGYGLLLLGFSLFLYFKFGKEPGLGRRVILLAMSLSIGCIFWGIMLTSFFGIEFPPDSKVRDVSLVNWMVKQKAAYLLEHKSKAYTDFIQEYPQLKSAATPIEFLMGVTREQEGMGKYVIYDDFQGNVLIELAIFIGAIHIILSFLRYLDKNWAAAGWVTFIIGSYLCFPAILGAISLIHYIFHIPYEPGTILGQYLLYTGLGLVVVLAIIQKKLAGAFEIMHVIGVFADVMSYLRIYALSLAGMIMATTFNQIGMKMPLYLGIFIIIAGQTVNLTLSIMGGIIHGLRLNFIEWYHYSFEGGGHPFHPLSLIRILKKEKKT
ncbi:MAG: hypothetical protein K940chlam9_00189 [Chlamydiae bacterium]|nr:hypothetical protein [Chlamydiota bacterium]